MLAASTALGLNDASAAARVKLLWGACAPDRFAETPWEGVFFRLNGFVHGGHRWFAYPNHNLLRFLNPETATSYSWRHERQRKTFYKVDLESRFVCLNLYWDYISIGCFNAMIEHLTRGADGGAQTRRSRLTLCPTGAVGHKPNSRW